MAPRYIGSSAVTGRKPPSGWYRASSRICCAASSFASPDTVASQSNITVRWYAVAMIAFSGSTQYDGMVARTSSTSNMHRGRAARSAICSSLRTRCTSNAVPSYVNG